MVEDPPDEHFSEAGRMSPEKKKKMGQKKRAPIMVRSGKKLLGRGVQGLNSEKRGRIFLRNRQSVNKKSRKKRGFGGKRGEKTVLIGRDSKNPKNLNAEKKLNETTTT